MRRALLSLVAGALGTVLLLAACGSDDRPPIAVQGPVPNGSIDGATSSPSGEGGVSAILTSVCEGGAEASTCQCPPMKSHAVTWTLPCGVSACFGDGTALACADDGTIAEVQGCPKGTTTSCPEAGPDGS